MSAEQPKQNRFENAVDYIRDKIITGELEPGSRITESSIASALQMSRGPIREALKSLEREGMVNYRPNKGYSVVFLSPKEVWEVFFLRGHLERIALEVSGGRIDFPHLMLMEKALDSMGKAQRAGNVNEMVSYDDVFHQAIITNSGIHRLELMWKSLSPLNLSMFYSGKRAAVFDFNNQWEKHVEMYEILSRGNLERSVDVVMQHYLNTGKKIYQNSIK